MAKKIKVNPQVRDQIMGELELTNRMIVYNALRYKTNSPSAKLIRRRALELGGEVWEIGDSSEELRQMKSAHPNLSDVKQE